MFMLIFYVLFIGKSYFCEKGEDQGPLPLFNTDDEKMGNMTLYNSQFQPFVKRAKGQWGEPVKCLPKRIQVLREDVVPFWVSLIYIISSSLVIAGYAIYRSFFVKKQDYHVYGMEGADNGDPTKVPLAESHEMKIKGATQLINEYDGGATYRGEEEAAQESSFQQQVTAALPPENQGNPNDTTTAAPPPSNNPFRHGENASNPFKQQPGYGT